MKQVIGRDGGIGVANSAIIDTINNPVKIVQQANGAIKYAGNNAVVVLNEARKVITAWALNKFGVR